MLRSRVPARTLAALAAVVGLVLLACSPSASPSVPPSATTQPSPSPTGLSDHVVPTPGGSLVDTSPSVATSSPVPSVSSSPPPAGLDVIQSLTWTIPAGGSQQIKVVFEGTHQAEIAVVALGSTIAATLRGKALPSGGSTTGAMLARLVLSDPVDGPLRVTNTGAAEAHVSVVVWIVTKRHLTVQPARTIVGKDETVRVAFVVSHPVPGEAIAVEVDPLGAKPTPLKVVPDGVGRWIGQFKSDIAGPHYISAQTTGAGSQRSGGANVRVRSGVVILDAFKAQFAPPSGGFPGALICSFTVTVTTAGSFDYAALLVDRSGAEVATMQGTMPLTEGTHGFDLVFDGARIVLSQRSGPYYIRDLSLTLAGSRDPEVIATELGPTDPYDYRDFQP